MMIIDLSFASGDLRIRTRSTPAVRHAVDLVQAVLALGDDGHLTIRSWTERLSPVDSDARYSIGDAIEELLRCCTHFETEEGLALLVRRVRRDAKLPECARQKLIQLIAPTLVVGWPNAG
jgi:hypothetical protein